MKLNIKVVPKSSRNLIKEKAGVLTVYTTTPPEKGLANKAILELLANYFQVPKNHVKIVVGHGTRNKIIEIIK